MYGAISSTENLLAAYHMADVAMRYSEFVPRAYNLVKSLGFTPGKIMPSRAFCSDESQGYPIILIAKHFGVFPFNHGRVGGTIATDRHGPHAHHGKDLVIIHASHVGYNPTSGEFGKYRRLQIDQHSHSTNCGKICGTLDWYTKEYDFAKNNILVSKRDNKYYIAIDNLLLHTDRGQGLMLRIDRLVKKNTRGEIQALRSLSTSKVFSISDKLLKQLKIGHWKEGRTQVIGADLTPNLFTFERDSDDQVENNLLNAMPHIVTSEWPALKAAQVNTQAEFDKAFRTVVQEPEYQGRKLLFISGLNVDISPEEGQLFPLTKFIPWAAYYQTEDGCHETWEQGELFQRLKGQSTENADQINLEDAIKEMGLQKEIKLPF